MKIQVFGAGCPSCKKMFEVVQTAVLKIGLDTKVEYICDVQQIIAMGLMQSPVLVVNGKPVLIGFTPDIGKITKAIQDNL